jgi:hypothetical protein
MTTTNYSVWGHSELVSHIHGLESKISKLENQLSEKEWDIIKDSLDFHYEGIQNVYEDSQDMGMKNILNAIELIQVKLSHIK